MGVSRFCLYPEHLTRLPRIGGIVDPNLEAIDALAPDLVLLQGHDERLDELARRRPWTVVGYRIETVEEVYAALSDLGKRLGCFAAAQREVARLRAALQPRGPPAGARVLPSVLLVFNHRPGRLGQVSSPGRGTFISQCLLAAGGRNCLDDLSPLGWHTVAKEIVLAKRPEVIIELSPEPLEPRVRQALRADWSRYRELPAVRDGRIAIVSGSELLVPGPRLDRLVDKLARALAGAVDVQ